MAIMMNVLPSHDSPRLILGLLLTGSAAIASAADYTPTFYGRFNVSVDNINHDGAMQLIRGNAATGNNEWQLSSNISMIGIKGEMDLDVSNLQVIYQAEFEIHVDDGENSDSNTFAQRNIFAGLSHKTFGTLKAGRFDTPLKKTEGKIDQFADVQADIDVLIGGQNRVSNIVQYSTPAMADIVSVNVAVIEAEGDDVDGDGVPETGFADVISSSLVVEYDWLYAAIAYEKNQNARRSVDGITLTANERVDSARAVFKATFAGFEGGILLQQSKDTAPGSALRDDSAMVSAAWSIERFKVKVQLGQSDGHISDERGRLAAVGLDIRLGDKTTAYTYASQLKLTEADLKDTTYAIGLLHKF